MSETKRDIGVVGLGTMGRNLARNLARGGYAVAGFDPDEAARESLRTSEPDHDFATPESLEGMVAVLERPRRILVMVPAGPIVDSVLGELEPLMDPGDVVIDGGNSLWHDTERREKAARDYHFMGMGVSGGAEGALVGPSMMPGGPKEGYERLRPLLESMAATSEHGHCVTWCGKGPAGHFVKMTHNGIEYGIMQILAEAVLLLRRGLGMSAAEAADVVAEWNAGDLGGFLTEITADILRVKDPQDPSRALLDQVLDTAGQKGTGRWTVLAAVELGVPIPTIAAAVDARALSSFGDVRRALATGDRREIPLSTEALRDAVFASALASYAQGFDLLKGADDEHHWSIDRVEVARIWTGGCIIRAKVLDRLMEVLGEAAGPLLAPGLASDFDARLEGWRKTVGAAASAGHLVPAMAASLTWWEQLSTGVGTARVIQAQRDRFGHHTFRRVDAPDVAAHDDWEP
ncbi:MAG: phosphogluconate dehydrogenase (NADP(+)-dependent, decarboxylating) [Sandaracinus sp.]|nr:phosphogluconate dehydrogenase (NADP(+)-dependent, decarboxylating) [Sandaracinus sp.]|tara:strand:- start:449 stop:1831 length:1383 start_codon:yes stop_codon:yes gene_type:complete